MKKFYYYARLNDNDICIEIVSRVSKLTDVKGYVELPEYNETVRYRKWLGSQWSAETYEPEVDTVIQDKLIALEEENTTLMDNIQTLTTENANLNTRVVELEELLASYIGGAI